MQKWCITYYFYFYFLSFSSFLSNHRFCKTNKQQRKAKQKPLGTPYPQLKEKRKQELNQISSIVSWTDLICFIGNPRSVRKWLHETSWVSHVSSAAETPKKNPDCRILYYSMWTFSLVYRSKNLKFKWKAESLKVHDVVEKQAHMQRRNRSVVQSFISESGVPLKSQPSFFSFKWLPHVEIYATFKLCRFLVQIWGAPQLVVLYL